MVFSLLLRLWYCVISSTLQCHKITLYSHLALCLLPTKSNTDCGSIPIRKLNFAMLIISQVKQNQQQRVGKKPPWLRMIQIHTKSASSPFYCAKCMLLRMLTFLPTVAYWGALDGGIDTCCPVGNVITLTSCVAIGRILKWGLHF